ncbi:MULTISPECIES: BlaI/MecI/CopY family transcriptional regulator [Staphylococcaceae]|nr:MULTISPECIES: BlaI/MecI/CopY family transcriptional regulator [Macrococcus]AQX82845.1 methicillin-resistance regulatory protein MecI [Macrococcus caseolyticus]AQX82886.1 methicillin-resistance regulatory protein MecI [Macrococcus caseolyticus]AQX82924.1 methicillin-resistance regulatory protein MecI [Macrococcus caseolyticus]ARQ03569.1 methicillin-resistance regulatory protein MecI [Macrococcus caseolyticus]AYE55829.1 methicillin-resistance regulatory protein MecI [Macrococcus caseolyticus]
MNKNHEIPASELTVMQVIWANKEGLSANQIIDYLSNDNQWSPKTIRTLINRLVDKNFLSKEKNSKVYIYKPLVKESSYKKNTTKSFINKLYDGALTNLVMNFAKQEKLTDDEIKKLKTLLEKLDN